MYIIVTDKAFDNELAYLIWQPDGWVEGWTWTRKECVQPATRDTMARRKFMFAHIEDAWRTVRHLNLKTGFVIKWRG